MSKPTQIQEKLNQTADGDHLFDGKTGTGKRGSWDAEFGNPGYVGDRDSATFSNGETDADVRRRLLGDAVEGNGNYSSEAESKRKRYEAWANEHGLEGADLTGYKSPSAANYGGFEGGMRFYSDAAKGHMKDNDIAQGRNVEAMSRTRDSITKNRGDQSIENAGDVAAYDATRAQQMQALDMDRNAALGGAPSEAALRSNIAMNGALGANAARVGASRNLSALAGGQTAGAQATMAQAGEVANSGAMARSNEIQDAMKQYGTRAGNVRQQDLNRLQQNTKNSMFNADANNKWKVGNANLLVQQGNLDNAYANQDQEWYQDSMDPAMRQFQNDMQMWGVEVGADEDALNAAFAKQQESAQHTRDLVNGFVTTGLTVGGGMVGGPAGAAVGGAAGQGFGAATNGVKW